MEAEHKGIALQAVDGTCGGQQQEHFWEDQKTRVVGKMQCKVARCMAQWASPQDNEQQQGAGATNTPIGKKCPSSTDKVPYPLMDCGQSKSNNSVNNDPATGGFLLRLAGRTWRVDRRMDKLVGQATEKRTQRGTKMPTRTYK
jgi:hypothetical protein